MGDGWLADNWVALLVIIVGFSIMGPIAMKAFGRMVKSKKDEGADRGEL